MAAPDRMVAGTARWASDGAERRPALRHDVVRDCACRRDHVLGRFWCSQCQGLWYGLNGTNGWCPSGTNARHTSAGSGNYYLRKS